MNYTIYKEPQMVGATTTSDGKRGLVPKPTVAQKDYFLKADGTWSSADPTPITNAEIDALWDS